MLRMRIFKFTCVLNPAVKLVDSIELLRPFTLLAPFVGVACGALVAASTTGIPLEPEVLFAVLVAVASAALLNGASNAFNQVCDIEVDRINKPLRPLPSGRVRVRDAEKMSAGLYLLSLVLASLVNRTFFILASFAALITILYSWKPVRLKNYGWIANSTIAVPRGLLLMVAGWSVLESPFSPIPWFIGSIFGLFLLGAASTKDFADIPGDEKYGARTLPIIYGVDKAAKVIAPFFVFPFLLIPLGVFTDILPPTAMFLSLLSLWGAYAAYLVVKDPKKVTPEANHPSWIHIYLIMTAGYAGFAIAFWV